MNGIVIHHGDVREVLPTLADESVNCVVTSPPYWGLRDYGVVGQLGLERTPEEYISKMVAVFREVRRVLRGDGTLWLNMGDSYCANPTTPGAHGFTDGRKNRDKRLNVGRVDGLKPKDLCGIPWLLAFALRADGWYLRQDIIWSKPNPMPESVTDRCTKAHEYIFLLSKSGRYYYDADAIKEPGSWEPTNSKMPDGWDTGEGGHGSIHRNGREKGARTTDKQRGHGRRHAGFNDRWDAMEKSQQCSTMRNKRDVWVVSPQPFPDAHFATFPEELIKPCILAGCPAGGTVLDPFCGSGTTALVARDNGCKAILIELSAEYIEIAKKRLGQEVLNFAECREEEI